MSSKRTPSEEYERALAQQLKAIRGEDAENRARLEAESKWAREWRASHPIERRTPRQHLAEHPITLHLRSLGIKKKELEAVFFRRNDGEEFEQWGLGSTDRLPVDRFRDMRVWRSLRWLVLENPPHSRDTRAAWELIARYMAEPLHHVAVQSNKTLRDAQIIANDKRKTNADDRVLSAYRDWESRCASVLQGKSAEERVKKYLVAKRESLSDRAKRRIRDLLKAGKIKLGSS